MRKDVEAFARTCHPCQAGKSSKTENPGIGKFEVPDQRFSSIHLDVVGPLPPSEGMSYLLTILDRTSRWLEAVPLPAATSKNCCDAFVRSWLSRYGACQKITSDNGNTFQANLWKDLNRTLGIEVNFVPVYHQQTNGAIERQHRTLKDSIKASLIEMGDKYKNNWM